MISQLVELEKLPIQRKQEEINIYEYKQESVRSFRSSLVSAQNLLKPYTAGSLDPPISASVSNEDVLTASAQSFAPPGTYLINVTALAQNQIITATQTLADLGLADENAALDTSGAIASGSFDFDINGVTVTVDTTTVSMAGLRNLIQNALDDPSATADGTALLLGQGTGKRISLSADQTGTANAFTIVDTNGLLGILGLDPGAAPAAEVQAAQDTAFSVNGVNFTDDDLVNSDAISGVALNFKQTGTSTITIALNPDEVASTLQDFINRYNSFQSQVSSVITEKRVQNPETFGELIAGAFNADPDLVGMLSDIRGDLTSVLTNTLGNPDFSATYSYAGAIGIDSEGFTSGFVDPNLKFDKATFDNAFAADPDAVMAFVAEFATKLDATMSRYTTVSVIPSDQGLLDALDKSFGTLIDKTQDTIEGMEERVEQYEQRLRDQFLAMESAVSALQLQQQSIAAFASQAPNPLGGLG